MVGLWPVVLHECQLDTRPTDLRSVPGLVQVFAQAGLESPVLGSVLMGIVNLFGSGLATLLMDRAGRRPLLLASHAGMGACLAALSAAFVLPGVPALWCVCERERKRGSLLVHSLLTGPCEVVQCVAVWKQRSSHAAGHVGGTGAMQTAPLKCTAAAGPRSAWK